MRPPKQRVVQSFSPIKRTRAPSQRPSAKVPAKAPVKVRKVSTEENAEIFSTDTNVVKKRKTAKKSKLIAFGWFGGKYMQLDFLLPLLPLDAEHFCDVFGGSGAVIMNAGPYPIETFNDINSDVVNFFAMLRREPKKLVKAISKTPYSREEHTIACTWEENLSEIERARRFYVRTMQSYVTIENPCESYWGFDTLSFNPRQKLGVQVGRWIGKHEKLMDVISRFRRIQIEHDTALKMIDRYDTPKTLFYLDPPYVSLTRTERHRGAYRHEMTDQDHSQLAETLQDIQGRAVISGYRSELYDKLYKSWNRIDAPPKVAKAGGTIRQDSVWRNF